MNETDFFSFYKDKKVLVTGHTGFKGSWLTKMLLRFGAQVTGYALDPPTEPNLFELSGIRNHEKFRHVAGDIKDQARLKKVFQESRPEIVFHLAAQPIVRESYQDPVGTYSTNVMGTVNVLECIRTTQNAEGALAVRSFLNVTTDKVYQNKEWCWGYRENEPLNGHDPYSNSKSCSELVTYSYKNSFFSSSEQEASETGRPLMAISTARAGNVIGGGDFAKDRIVPDSVKAVKDAFDRKSQEAEIIVRNPYSIRPYQHVLEPLFMYLTITMMQYEDVKFAGCYNVGPDESDCVSTGDLVDLFCTKWNENTDLFPKVRWKTIAENNAPQEASYLKLDCSKAKNMFGWKPRWNIEMAVEQTVRFTRAWIQKESIRDEIEREIAEYLTC